MLLPSRRSGVVVLVLLFTSKQNLAFVNASSVSPTTSISTPTTAGQSKGTCEARTINYITDSLPQQCLRKEWNGFNGTGSGSASLNGTQAQGNATTMSADVTAIPSPSSTAPETAEASATDLETGELGEASFLSFEEWKKQTLEKAGQANANIGTKKSADGKKRDSESIQNNLDSLGDDGEIDLDFSSFRSGGKGEDAGQTTDVGNAEVKESQEVKRDHHRSKDAGITCKERFSYASFDAGATILKTHPGAKNSKAVLIENKDSYMLSECSVQNKFIIIELSEDIWIDTVVLANYEFFSSQIRTFRVSLSDKYPVKIDKWKDVGTYEARNSREIQAFLIANPQIWARYIRIEFLSHYGNEYYCPLSLVRVHGTRMLESWKETEANNDDDEGESEDEEAFVPDAVADVVQEEEKLRAAAEEMLRAAISDGHAKEDEDKGTARNSLVGKTTPWINASLFEVASSDWLEDTCLPGEAPDDVPAVAVPTDSATTSLTGTISTSQASSSSSTSAVESQSTKNSTSSTPASSKAEPVVTSSSIVKEASISVSVPSNNTSTQSLPVSTSSAPASKSQGVTTTPKEKATVTASASSSLPTIQESFFKAVSRRLNFLETNSTLSLKYIEEQSRFLREAFTKVEKKQLQKTTTFLDTLNSTVLDELRHFRQQYDEIWQSTVISLESQREESRREILAISSRLNILADEVVFQKRMSIVQSVLILLCLGLVIFTHVSGSGAGDYANMHNRMRFMAGMGMESPVESPPQSPEYTRRDPMRTGIPWLEVDHERQGSDQMDGSRSMEYESPRTPISAYSDNEEIAYTPPSGQDDAFNRNEAELPALPVEEDEFEEQEEPPSILNYPSDDMLTESAIPMPEVIVITAPEIPPLSPARTPRKPTPMILQEASPPASIAEDVPPIFNSSPPPEPQPIPLLEFPDEPVPESNTPQHFRSTSNLDLTQTLPRLPSPPPEPLTDSPMNDQTDVERNGVCVAVPMNGSNKRYSISMPTAHVHDLHSRRPTISSSPPIQSYSAEHFEIHDSFYSSPTVESHSAEHFESQDPVDFSSPIPLKIKRGSFSIARKPLPALPGDP